jgi:cytochrome c-type biogenesis protein CcmF
VRPTSDLTSERVALGAVVDVTRGGRHVATLLPSRGYYPSLDQQNLGRVGRFFNGESTSEVGLRSGPTRDLWTAVQPDLAPIQRSISDADRRFPDANAPLEGFLVSTLARRYLAGPAAAEFRVVISPLVAWVWIGGIVVVAGAMISLWPAPLRRYAPAPARLRAPAPVAVRQI